MELKTITNEEEYKEMLAWVDQQFDVSPELNTPEGDNLKTALSFIKAYEDIHYPIPKPSE